jgi:hypothetical protein
MKELLQDLISRHDYQPTYEQVNEIFKLLGSTFRADERTTVNQSIMILILTVIDKIEVVNEET